MPKIVLATVTARYTHTAFGLRYLLANMGPWRQYTVLKEFFLGQTPLHIAESILDEHPDIVGLGVYIWNLPVVTQIGQILKRVKPNLILVLGGPEISYEYEKEPLFEIADYLIRGEGDQVFPQLVHKLLIGERVPEKIISAPFCDLASLNLPYETYTPEDIQKRIIYVETTRGCPFQCKFCISSLERCVREFPLDKILDSFEILIARGARYFTFVDRTFNLDLNRIKKILNFFLENWCEDMQLHLEILPSRLTAEIIDLLAQFPKGGLYLECGLQSTNPQALEAVGRYQSVEETLANLQQLITRTNAEIHVDLVAGFPFETLESFGDAFNTVVALAPHVIQLGILKRLKGTELTQYESDGELVFAPFPPYEILRTAWMSFAELQQLKKMARYVEIFYNSGNFKNTLTLWHRAVPAPFNSYLAFTDFMWKKLRRTHEISLATQAECLFEFLCQNDIALPHLIMEKIQEDYGKVKGRKQRLNLKPVLPGTTI